MNDNPRLAYIEPNWKFKPNEIGDSVKISTENTAVKWSLVLV